MSETVEVNAAALTSICVAVFSEGGEIDIVGVGSESQCRAMIRDHARAMPPPSPLIKNTSRHYIIESWPFGKVCMPMQVEGPKKFIAYFNHKGKEERR